MTSILYSGYERNYSNLSERNQPPQKEYHRNNLTHEQIAEHIREYLARGGGIKYYQPGESATNGMYTPIAFTQCAKERIVGRERRPVIATHIETGERTLYSSILSAEGKGFTPACISACCRGRQKQHRGFLWSYVYE